MCRKGNGKYYEVHRKQAEIKSEPHEEQSKPSTGKYAFRLFLPPKQCRLESAHRSQSLDRISKKIREKTKRNDPAPPREKIKKREAVVSGWVNYFSIAKAKSKMQEPDEPVWARLRIGIWKQWKKPKTKQIRLIQLGIAKQKAYEWSNSRKSYCRRAHSTILCRALNNNYFKGLKYVGFTHYYYWKTEHQLKQPPCTERYARWCERKVWIYGRHCFSAQPPVSLRAV